MTTITIGDQTLDYTEHSQGEIPVVFIHGIAHNQYNWLDFPQQFTSLGRVITLSLPGHVPSRFPASFRQKTITDSWAGDVLAEALEKITGGKPAILIGHSTGGYISLAAAWRAPHLVRQVISLGGFAEGKWTGSIGRAQRYRYFGPVGNLIFNTWLKIGTGNPKIWDSVWEHCSYDKAAFAANPAFAANRDRINQTAQQTDIRAVRMWFYQMHRVADLRPYLSQIEAPVLAVAGKQDSLVPPQQAEIIAKGVQHGTLQLLEGMDHAMFAEQPERVKACILDWLVPQLETQPVALAH